MNFSDLPPRVQEYLNDRFGRYNINGEDAFNTPSIIPEEIKNLSPENIISYMEKKHISHVYPKSKFPELESELSNIILEDASPNMQRGAEIMTPNEYLNAQNDLRDDIIDGDIDEDGLIDLHKEIIKTDDNDFFSDLIGLSIPLGIIVSGSEVLKRLNNKEININEVPGEFFYKTGGRTVKLFVVGSLISTGSPILVTSTVGYILYKSKKLISKVFDLTFSKNSTKKLETVELYGDFFKDNVHFESQGVMKTTYSVIENNTLIKVLNSAHVRMVDDLYSKYPYSFKIIAPIEAVEVVKGELIDSSIIFCSSTEYTKIKNKYYRN
tara:strand:+ start:64 stop:1035 length:972 start_codon:yes stop_codon:yes gene_type:complete